MVTFIEYLQSFSSPSLDRFFILISSMTSELVFFGILGYLYWCYDQNKAYVIGLTLLFSFTMNTALKNIFRIPRPYTYASIRQIDTSTGYGYSFPSGHAQLSTTFASSIGFMFRRRLIYILGAVLVLMTGLSRMYLGVHTPLDIAAGILTGLLMSLAALIVIKYPKYTLALSVIALLLVNGLQLFVHETDLAKMAGFTTGFVFGHYFALRFIPHNTAAPIKFQIAKLIVGVSVVYLIKLCVKSLTPLPYIEYLSLGVSITVILPFIWARAQAFLLKK